MNYTKLLELSKQFIKDSGVPITVFCRKCKIGVSTFYRWRRHEIKISSKLAHRINDYLYQFGYEAF